MIAKGSRIARVRRGPLRAIAATLPNGDEVLECGHGYAPDPRNRHLPPAKRRCPECPYDCGEKRAAWEREYHLHRHRMRKALSDAAEPMAVGA